MIVRGRNKHVVFDHILGSVSVDGVHYAIPSEVERLGCETNRVKAVRFGCTGNPEIYYLDPDKSYVCQESRKKIFKKNCLSNQ